MGEVWRLAIVPCIPIVDLLIIVLMEPMEAEYWCHSCQKTVTCNEEVLCSLCGSAFIEEVHYERHINVPAILRETDMTELTERLRMLYTMLHEMRSMQFAHEEDDDPFHDREIDALPVAPALVDQCAICLHSHEDQVRALPCNHTFHEVCLRKWLKLKGVCPTCKQSARANRQRG